MDDTARCAAILRREAEGLRRAAEKCDASTDARDACAEAEAILMDVAYRLEHPPATVREEVG